MNRPAISVGKKNFKILSFFKKAVLLGGFFILPIAIFYITVIIYSSGKDKIVTQRQD